MNKNEKEHSIEFHEIETNLRARLRELEACEYFLSYIIHTIHDGAGHRDPDLVEAMSVIQMHIYKAKNYTWQNVAMVSTISPDMRKLLEDKLKHLVGNNYLSVNEFLGHRWNHNATAEDDFKEFVKARLADALKIRDPSVDIVEVPSRKITPEL